MKEGWVLSNASADMCWGLKSVCVCVCVWVCLCWGLKSGSQANQTSWKFCLTDGIFVKGGDKPAGGWQHLLLSPVTWVWLLRLTCRENQLEQLLLWSLHVCHGTCMPTHIHIYEISVKKNSGQSILHSTSNVWGSWFHHITTNFAVFCFNCSFSSWIWGDIPLWFPCVLY